MSRRIDSEFVRNLSVRARRRIVNKLIEGCKTQKEAAKLLGVSRQALYHYISDKYQPSDAKILNLLGMLRREDFHNILVEDVEEYIRLVKDVVGEAKVRRRLSGLFT